MAKRLIRLFGFTAHDAPGEAEAECALLQREGVVDAVLSEDVDTIMFGCGMTLRSWSAESKGSTIPTHMTVYDADAVKKGASGLDREGMVLVALMSGGDYIPEGIPGCGIKVACEAARAGFGRSLCRIKKSDKAALEQWKADLSHELRTNEKGFFRTRHKALVIPDDFPNMDVLRYYTHPVVSQEAAVDRLGREFPSKIPVDVVGLREFVRDTFDWTYKTGAVKFIKLMAPSILVKALLDASTDDSVMPNDLEMVKKLESTLVKAITTKRSHFSTGGTPELRVSYIPIDMVPLDLEAEPEEEVTEYGRSGLALNSDDEFEEEVVADAGEEGSKTTAKKKGFHPLQPDVVWVPESIVKLGAPLTVEDWEDSKRAKEAAAVAAPKKGRKPAAPRKKMSDMPAGSLDKWVKVTKSAPVPVEKDIVASSAASISSQPQPSVPRSQRSLVPSAPIYLTSSPVKASIAYKEPVPSPPRARKPRKAASVQPSFSNTNPWTLAGSQVTGARITKTVTPSTPTKKTKPPFRSQQEPILISSSPPAAPLYSPQERITTTQNNHEPPFSSSPPTQPSPRSQRKHRHPSSPTIAPRATRSRKPPPDTSNKKQTSIKGFGAVSRAATTSTKPPPPPASRNDPFTFSSDEDDGDLSAIFQPQPEKKTDNPTVSDPVWLDDDDHDTSYHSFPDLDAIRARDTEKVSQPPGLTEAQWLEDDDGLEVSIKPVVKRMFIPRTSNIGFFKEITVTPEEAERLERTHPRAYRLSDVSVVDLTGPDP